MTEASIIRPAWSVRLWELLDQPHRGWSSHLYSDTEVTGTTGEPIGPYTLTTIPPQAGHQAGHLRPVLGLESWFRDPDEEPQPPGSAGWTGLSIHQELAALLALILGIRLRCDDPAIRRRRDDGSIATYHPSAHAVPAAPSSPWGTPILPGHSARTADLGPVRGYLETLPDLPPELSVQLVRAARQYADALWMAESEPELSWLLLVSAVEVAATAHQAATADYTELLQADFPRSAEALLAAGGQDLLAEAATTEFANLLKSTARLLAFTREFQPDPPTWRTADQAAQLPWSRGKMRDALSTVYRHRSARLHAGVAFPWPLLIPPLPASDGLPAERFPDGPYGSGDAVWPATELPMTLDAFAYLVRGMLLRWWAKMADGAVPGAD